MKIRFVGVFFLGCSYAIGQQVWKVNCQGGPGVHFTDLPPAVAAASPGDTIWLYTTPAGCQTVYTTTTIDKPLHIIGFGVYAPAPAPGSPPTSSGAAGVLTIANLPAGQMVTISNFGIGFGTFQSTFGLRIVNCAGQVVLDHFGCYSLGLAGCQLEILDCADVVLRGGDVYYAGTPLTIINSNVLMTTTTWRSGVGTFSPPLGATQTASAISLVNSTLTITNSIVEGASEIPSLGPQFVSRPGVLMDNSTMFLGAAATVRGGQIAGYPGFTHAAYCHSTGSIGASRVYRDPRTNVTDPGPFCMTTIPREIPATFHGLVVAGGAFNVGVVGPVDGFALLVLGNLTPLPTPTPFGPLVMDPLTVLYLDLLALPQPIGYVQRPFVCPTSAPTAHAFVLQALTLSPAGVFGLTVPSPLTVGWPHGQIP